MPTLTPPTSNRYDWSSEALHGIARDGPATSFPQICGVGASGNRTLWHEIATAISTEGRGKNNVLSGNRYGGLTFWAPNINIVRDPRWGRGQETPGEDPTINGDYAEQFVAGMQGDQSSGYLKVSACLKHYAAYSGETNRMAFSANVTSQDMEDSYLPAFQAGVERGNASGVMCSYAAVTYGAGVYGAGSQHGAIPACANKVLLTDLLRDKWGFNGYVTSDCQAVSNVQKHDHYTNLTNETVMAVLAAGMDTDCGGFMGNTTMAPLLKEAAFKPLVQTALERLFTIQLRLGIADPVAKVPWAHYGAEVVNTPAHQALAKEAADQSIVLLKNTNKTLPLERKKAMSLAVMGRLANATTNMQGNYFGRAPYLISPVAGLQAYGTVAWTDGHDVAVAIKMAVAADAVVLVVGLTSDGGRPADEAEGFDRTSLLLPGAQDAFVAAVSAAAGKKGIPVTVVVMGGGALDLSAIKANDDVQGIMWCGYPGQSGGAAIADVVFGVTNPSAKLTLTWFPEELTKQVAVTDMHMRPNATTGNPGRTYRFYTGDPVFRFGEGMSYTTFEHTVTTPPVWTVLSEDFGRGMDLSSLSKIVGATVSVSTVNTGDRDGAEIVQLYVAPPGAGVGGKPLRSLVAFEKVLISAGATATTVLEVAAQHLTVTDHRGVRQIVKGEWMVWVGADGEDTAATLLVA